jgi:serine-type D-Ala-D-Ala carboxypeptidase/endopeptidase (penicillin-binding protein 4)
LSRAGRARGRAVAILAGAVLAVLLVAPAGAAASISMKLTAALTSRGLAGDGTSVGVYDLTAKRALYTLRWDVPRLPASNEKLVTSATALADWSAVYRFSTQLSFQNAGPSPDGVVHGDVYLKGLGDPTLSTASFQSAHLGLRTSDLGAFVAKLQALGVTKIAGRVVADDSAFDRARAVASWRPGMTAYCGPLSALTLNEGFGPDGSYVGDPALWAAGRLTTLLRAAGVGVTHQAARGTVPASATLVATERSASLSSILAAMDKPSDDFLAEELLKGLGASFGGAGTTAAGAAVADQFLQSVGVTSGYRIHDGSGLSYTDKLSAHAIIDLLRAMTSRPDFRTFREALAVAGVDGTLSDRMRGTAAAGNVHAKTGTLAAASCLSGYVTSAGGHELAFSILMNGSGLSQTEAHAAQDAVAEILARSSP